MAKQEMLVVTCDRCRAFQRVTKRVKDRNYFDIPAKWQEWDNRKGTVALLCPKCDAELMGFLQISTKEVANVG